VLCITSFSPASIGSFKKRLDELFKKIKADSIESLAIDLRNNTGGYILLQEYLMSFLTPEGTKYSNHYVYKRSDYDRFEQLSKVQKWRFKKTAKRYYPNGAIAQEWDFYNSPKGTIDTVLNEPILSNRYKQEFRGKCTLFINGMSMSASANFAAWFATSDRGIIVGTPATGTYTGTFANPITIYLNNTALPIMISTMKVNSPLDSSNKSILPTVLLTPTSGDIQEGKDIHLSYFLSH
jgi:C-terminal processing protease CtpA/Prc